MRMRTVRVQLHVALEHVLRLAPRDGRAEGSVVQGRQALYTYCIERDGGVWFARGGTNALIAGMVRQAEAMLGVTASVDRSADSSNVSLAPRWTPPRPPVAERPQGHQQGSRNG